ncbi:MAG TPA: hypothetical protein VGR53_04270 [Nitrososphaerales archaeon]|nr:hypothetical protein [Nitrososphaerales archaeon]
MAERILGWLERILLPQVYELKGELKAISARMDGEFKAVHSEIRRVEEKLGTKIDGLDKRMDVTQRLTKVEEELKELRANA